MALATLKKIDGVIVLPLPAESLEQLELTDGSSVNISVENGCILIETGKRRIPHFNLDDLLDEWELVPEEIREYREWVDAPRVGRELI